MSSVVTTPAFRTTASLTIAGEAVAGASTLDVVNPAIGEVFASAPDASPDQLDAAVQAAASPALSLPARGSPPLQPTISNV